MSTPTSRVFAALTDAAAFPDDPEARREAAPLVGELFAIARHHQRDEAVPLIAEALDDAGIGTAGSLTDLADTVYTAARKETHQ